MSIELCVSLLVDTVMYRGRGQLEGFCATVISIAVRCAVAFR